jgi:hypothetical protein
MRRLTLILALSCSLVAAGCGSHEEVRTLAETEGIYLDLGDHVKYQVQISRYMNPSDTEDRAYFTGLPEGTTQPKGDEVWFGVFIRAQNTTDETVIPANEFEIVDTQENVFRPVPLNPDENPYAYRPDPLGPKGVIPAPDSAAAESTIQGSLLLFKVTAESLQNRPLEFRFRRGSGTQGVVDLDV